MRRMKLAVTFLVLGAGCGGPPKDRPLVPGYGRATAEQCTEAVDNYAKMQKETRRSRHVFHRPDRVGANDSEERDHRIELCQAEAAAEEAVCVANAKTIGAAEECAPTWTW